MNREDDLIRRGDVVRVITHCEDHDLGGGWMLTDIAALPAAKPVVKVKPLVWEHLRNSYRAPAPLFGHIRVESYSTDYWTVHWSVPGYTDLLIQGSFDTPEAAKAAAQADYEARILAALDVQPAPDVAQCCMCGKNGLSTEEDGGPECELSDGRWVCSRDCYERAVQPAPDVAALVEALQRIACGNPTCDSPEADAQNSAAIARAALAALEARK
jgi:hypothetical protein